MSKFVIWLADDGDGVERKEAGVEELPEIDMEEAAKAEESGSLAVAGSGSRDNEIELCSTTAPFGSDALPVVVLTWREKYLS